MKVHKKQPDSKPQKSSLKNLINETILDFDKDRIHTFRLEIKKLKAAMLLIQATKKSFNLKKKYRDIRPFYKDLGAVREIQIQKEQFQKPENNKALKPSFRKKYTQLLDETLLERELLTIQNFDESVIKTVKKVKKQVKKALKDLSPNDFKRYFKARICKLKKTLDTLDFSEKKTHNLRILIKEIKFNARFKKKVAEKALAKNKIDLPALEDLQKWLGNWHDNIVLKHKLAQLHGSLWLQNGENEALMQFKTSVEVETCFIKNSIKKALNMDY